MDKNSVVILLLYFSKIFAKFAELTTRNFAKLKRIIKKNNSINTHKPTGLVSVVLYDYSYSTLDWAECGLDWLLPLGIVGRAELGLNVDWPQFGLGEIWARLSARLVVLRVEWAGHSVGLNIN